jgi:galactoside O-acetyltransferase
LLPLYKPFFTDHDDHYPQEAEELARARQRGKALCYEINRLHPDDIKGRFAQQRKR